MIWQFFSISHQMEVPVKPRWPTDRGEKLAPLADLSGLGVSQPSAQVEFGTFSSLAKNSSSSAFGKKSSFPCRQRLRQANRAWMSRADEKRPAWPATPPIASALSSWTSPQRILFCHGQFSVGAILS